MTFFTRKDSIVRQIWGKSDIILFIFAGAAAEFALNRQVDWLYFTGKLPADPIGRLFSTVSYARDIVFSEESDANKAIDKITAIHQGVEKKRQRRIPDEAYRDVLYMLIYYSIASFELLERKMTAEEKSEVFDVFLRVGKRMELKDLPENFTDWLRDREVHLNADLVFSEATADLFLRYKRSLGALRFYLLLEAQKLLIPDQVRRLLRKGKWSLLRPAVPLYRMSRKMWVVQSIKTLLLPEQYKKQILALNVTD